MHRSSLLRPLRRSHGLCVFILINTNTLRSLQRGCTKLLQLHGHGFDYASLLAKTPAQQPCMGFVYLNTNALRSLQRGCSCNLCTKCEGQSAKINAIYNLHCAMCNRQSAIHMHCAMCHRQVTIHIVQCGIYNLQSTLYNVQSTIYNPHCTMSNQQSTIYNPHCAISNLQSTIQNLHGGL